MSLRSNLQAVGAASKGVQGLLHQLLMLFLKNQVRVWWMGTFCVCVRILVWGAGGRASRVVCRVGGLMCVFACVGLAGGGAGVGALPASPAVPG